jgi:hypothetical protein
MPGDSADVPVFDVGNAFIGPHPANLVCGQVNGPQGPMVVVTIRSAGTTLSVLMSRDDALTWARLIRNTAQSITPLVIPNGAKLG